MNATINNAWVDSYLDALLTKGGLSAEHIGGGAASTTGSGTGTGKLAALDEDRSIAARYYVHQILSLDEDRIRQAWSKAARSGIHQAERDARMEHLSWRVWAMKRRRAQVEAATESDRREAAAQLLLDSAVGDEDEVDATTLQTLHDLNTNAISGYEDEEAQSAPSDYSWAGVKDYPAAAAAPTIVPPGLARLRARPPTGGAATGNILAVAASKAAAAPVPAAARAEKPAGGYPNAMSPPYPSQTPFGRPGAAPTGTISPGPGGTVAGATPLAAAPPSGMVGPDPLLVSRFPRLYIMLISLHGLVRGEKMELGKDPDTGGQVKYVVELAKALACFPSVARVDLLTRYIADPHVDASYSVPEERLQLPQLPPSVAAANNASAAEAAGSYNDLRDFESAASGSAARGAFIVRLPCGPPDVYLRKEELWPHVREFSDRAIAHAQATLAKLQETCGPTELYAVHGHYADAGEVASLVASSLGVDCVLTGHSLGRNKKEHLLKSGNTTLSEVEATYAISRRIEAEERALDAASCVFTSTQQEVAQQWGHYDGYSDELSAALQLRPCRGYHVPRMCVIPPGLDFSNLKVTMPSDPWEEVLGTSLASMSYTPLGTAPPSPGMRTRRQSYNNLLEMPNTAPSLAPGAPISPRGRESSAGQDALAAGGSSPTASSAVASLQGDASSASALLSPSSVGTASNRASHAGMGAFATDGFSVPTKDFGGRSSKRASDFGGGGDDSAGHWVTTATANGISTSGPQVSGTPPGSSSMGGFAHSRRTSHAGGTITPRSPGGGVPPSAGGAPGTGELAPRMSIFGNPMGQPEEEPGIWREVNRFLRHPGRPVILAMSRPDAKKNVLALVRAYGTSPLLRSLANLVLVLGNRDAIDAMAPGSARVMSDVLKLVDAYDLYGYCAYPKKHAQSDISDIYLLAAKTKGVFVNIALQEPFGLTLIEAAAHGVPIVATTNGGPVDIVATLRNGVLVEPTDTQAIADACASIITMQRTWEEYSDSGRRNITAYSWPSHCARYLRTVEDQKATQVAAARSRLGGQSQGGTRIRQTLSLSYDDLTSLAHAIASTTNANSTTVLNDAANNVAAVAAKTTEQSGEGGSEAGGEQKENSSSSGNPAPAPPASTEPKDSTNGAPLLPAELHNVGTLGETPRREVQGQDKDIDNMVHAAEEHEQHPHHHRTESAPSIDTHIPRLKVRTGKDSSSNNTPAAHTPIAAAADNQAAAEEAVPAAAAAPPPAKAMSEEDALLAQIGGGRSLSALATISMPGFGGQRGGLAALLGQATEQHNNKALAVHRAPSGSAVPRIALHERFIVFNFDTVDELRSMAPVIKTLLSAAQAAAAGGRSGSGSAAGTAPAPPPAGPSDEAPPSGSGGSGSGFLNLLRGGSKAAGMGAELLAGLLQSSCGASANLAAMGVGIMCMWGGRDMRLMLEREGIDYHQLDFMISDAGALIWHAVQGDAPQPSSVAGGAAAMGNEDATNHITFMTDDEWERHAEWRWDERVVSQVLRRILGSKTGWGKLHFVRDAGTSAKSAASSAPTGTTAVSVTVSPQSSPLHYMLDVAVLGGTRSGGKNPLTESEVALALLGAIRRKLRMSGVRAQVAVGPHCVLPSSTAAALASGGSTGRTLSSALANVIASVTNSVARSGSSLVMSGAGAAGGPHHLRIHVTPLRCSRALALRHLAQRFKRPLGTNWSVVACTAPAGTPAPNVPTTASGLYLSGADKGSTQQLALLSSTDSEDVVGGLQQVVLVPGPSPSDNASVVAFPVDISVYSPTQVPLMKAGNDQQQLVGEGRSRVLLVADQQ